MKLEETVKAHLKWSADLKNRLSEELSSTIAKAAQLAINSLKSGGKVLIAGNGGSAADAQHIAAELVGRFEMDREPLPAIALTTDTSILTAIANDYGFDTVFLKQLEALAKEEDIFLAISTSGNSANVLAAVEAAQIKGIKVVALTGGDGGKIAEAADIAIVVPEKNTARIQECHITIGHIICHLVEKTLFA